VHDTVEVEDPHVKSSQNNVLEDFFSFLFMPLFLSMYVQLDETERIETVGELACVNSGCVDPISNH
jgi:hypothetical protein